jgi:hypothetical protein
MRLTDREAVDQIRDLLTDTEDWSGGDLLMQIQDLVLQTGRDCGGETSTSRQVDIAT